MKIGIFGGTFNPPHKGHLNIAQSAIACGLDKLIIVPTNIPPHKELPSNTASPEQRFEMANLLADEINVNGASVEVSRYELEHSGKSYTVDTLGYFHEKYRNDELFLIVGADMLLSFDTCWKSPDKILSLCRVRAFYRNSDKQPELVKCAESLSKKYSADISVVDCPAVEVSSTDIRDNLQIGTGHEQLTESIFNYIKENNLYNFNKTLYGLRKAAKERLSADRYAHVLRCEVQAAKLAKYLNFDEMKARTAAILHDITKGLKRNKQLELCNAYGIDHECAVKIPNPILHAVTGAYIAKTEFKCSPEIENAIRYHSTGRPNMSLLEKIILISDMTEAGRDYDGVEEIREEVFKNIDDALALALKGKYDHITGSGGTPTENLQEAMRQYCPSENDNPVKSCVPFVGKDTICRQSAVKFKPGTSSSF